MTYTNYQFYTQDYMGKVIPSPAQFEALVIKATAYINQITDNRIETVTDAVQMAVCAVCDALAIHSGREGIQSENNDGYSVSYVPGSLSKEMYTAAKLFLPSELLYRGF